MGIESRKTLSRWFGFTRTYKLVRRSLLFNRIKLKVHVSRRKNFGSCSDYVWNLLFNSPVLASRYTIAYYHSLHLLISQRKTQRVNPGNETSLFPTKNNASPSVIATLPGRANHNCRIVGTAHALSRERIPAIRWLYYHTPWETRSRSIILPLYYPSSLCVTLSHTEIFERL